MDKHSVKIRIKSNLRRFVAWGYYLSGMHKTAHQGKVLILMYHRILKDDDELIPYTQPGMYVKESVFEFQMDYISKNYHVLSLKDLMKAWKEGWLDKDKRYCVVTFDDGWLDNYLNAYPILKKNNMPAYDFKTRQLKVIFFILIYNKLNLNQLIS